MADETVLTAKTIIDVEDKATSKLTKIKKEYAELNELIKTNEKNIKSLNAALDKLPQKRKSQHMSKDTYERRYNDLTSSLNNEQQDLKANRELLKVYKKEIDALEKEAKAAEENAAALNENTETIKRNTQRQKNADSKAETASNQKVNAERKEADVANKSAHSKQEQAKKEEAASNESVSTIKKGSKAEFDRQTRRMNAETRRLKAEHDYETRNKNAEARLLRAKGEYAASMAKAAKYEDQTHYYQKKRTTTYQTGRGLISAGGYLGKNLSSPTGNILGSAFQFAGAALTTPAVGAAIAVQQLTKGVNQLASASIKAYGDIEALKVQLGVVYGNRTQSDAMFGQLSSYATKSPFGVSQVTEIATLLKQSGVSSSNLMSTIGMLGDTAGGNMERMKRIANNYAQIISIGKASMLDMRQFAYAGIPIFEKVSEQLGVSQTTLRNMISDGKVTAEVITKAFQDMTTEGGIFFDATSKGAETLKTRLVNLKDIKSFALSSLGERFLRIGETYGNDSFAYKGISIAEDFYDKLNKRTSLKNIENSVKTIEKNNTKQKELEDLIQFAKENGYEDAVIKTFESELSKLRNIYNPDKIRSINANLYESYDGNKKASDTRENLYKRLDQNEDEIEILRDSHNETLKKIGEDYEKAINTDNGINLEEYNRLMNEENSVYKMKLQVLTAEKNDLEENIKILDNQKKITEAIRQGWLESKTIEEQQTIYDKVTDASRDSRSTFNDLSQMEQFYQQTEAYKKNEQAVLIERLKSSQDLLEEIATHTAEGTKIISFGQVAGTKLTDYIRKGAVQGRKLATTADAASAGEDWYTLKNQINTAYSTITGKLGANKYDGSMQSQAWAILEGLSPQEFMGTNSIGSFYDRFNKNFYPVQQNIFSRYLGATDEDSRNFWKGIYDTLSQSLLEYSSLDTAPEGWEEGVDTGSKSTKAIPLWKRLLASATGLTSEPITSTNEALSLFANNVSVRNAASSVIGAALNNGFGVGSVQSMLATNGIRQRVGENGVVSYQIDWEKTRQNLELFSDRLSASSDVIASYTNSLKTEYNTFLQLLATATVSGESQDIKSNKVVSARVLGQIVQNTDEQLVNTFASGVTDLQGNAVTWDSSKNTWVNSNNQAITEEQLQITDDLFVFIKGELPKIKKSLIDFGNGEAINNVFGNMLDKVSEKALDPVLSEFSTIFDRLEDSTKNILRGQVVENIRYTAEAGILGEGGLWRSPEDVLASALNANDENQEKAKEVIKAAAESLMKKYGGIDQFEYLLELMDKEDKTNKENDIPLWKRTIASITGLATTAITDRKSAFETYRDEVANRNTAKGVFASMLQGGMGVNDILALTRASGVMNENFADDGVQTFQLDIKKSSEYIKEFSMQLSASTDVITAYKNGLTSQYDTYISLMTEGMFASEQNTVSPKSRTMSAKTLGKAAQSFNDQLIYAFGNNITDMNGNAVSFNKETGEFTDSQGNIIAEEQLKITDTLYELIRAELPKIRGQIADTNKRLAENTILNNLTTAVSSTKLMSALLAKTRNANFARLSDDNKQIYIDTLKENLKLGLQDSGFNSVEDLLYKFTMGDTNASQIVYKAIDNLTNANTALGTFTDILNSLNDNELLQNANKVASDLIGGFSGGGYEGDFMYRNFGKEMLSQLGYGDVRLSDVASIMDKNNYGVRSTAAKFANGLSSGAFSTQNMIDDLREQGLSEGYIERLEKANNVWQDQYSILQEIIESYGEITDKTVAHKLAVESESRSLAGLNEKLEDIAVQGAKDSFTSIFETMGSTLSTSSSYAKDLASSMKEIGAGIIKNLGSEMATAGFRIAGAAAYEQNWAGVAAGLSLAAAGGFASGLGNAVAKSSSDDTTGKLQSLTEQIKALLKQARDDALYYENNMRHQEAIGKNNAYSSRSVNDALIDTNGKIITTNPKDYLIATTNPKGLVSNNSAPVINFNVIDNAGVSVKQEKKVMPDGSIELVAIIENAVGNYIASSKSDEAFKVRNLRMNGNYSVR